jgi:hypothetical protein
MVEMIFVENVYFSGLAFLQCDWKMHLHMLQMHEFGMFLLQLEFVNETLETGACFFSRPTPSWLPPGRSTRSIACCKLGFIVN